MRVFVAGATGDVLALDEAVRDFAADLVMHQRTDLPDDESRSTRRGRILEVVD